MVKELVNGARVLASTQICSKRYLNATIVGQVIHIFVYSAEKQGFFSA